MGAVAGCIAPERKEKVVRLHSGAPVRDSISPDRKELKKVVSLQKSDSNVIELILADNTSTVKRSSANQGDAVNILKSIMSYTQAKGGDRSSLSHYNEPLQHSSRHSEIRQSEIKLDFKPQFRESKSEFRSDYRTPQRNPFRSQYRPAIIVEEEREQQQEQQEQQNLSRQSEIAQARPRRDSLEYIQQLMRGQKDHTPRYIKQAQRLQGEDIQADDLSFLKLIHIEHAPHARLHDYLSVI